MQTIKKFSKQSGIKLAITFLAATSLTAESASAATSFGVTDLITDDQTANPAQVTDSNLVNAWGISFSSTSPFWLSANGTGVSPVYKVDPNTNVSSNALLTVTIPGVAPNIGPVTGQVFNSNSQAFIFGTATKGDSFLFASEDGTISGWNGGTTAHVWQAAADANVYKGEAEATVNVNNTNYSYLYAANFRADSIDVINGSSSNPTLSGNFSDPNLPTGYAPFDIQNLAGNIFVTYAQQDSAKHDDVAGVGHGFVDEFNTQGQFIARIASGGTLDSPWGLAIAPSSFGALAGDLLVGNFGDGTINAFNLVTHNFDGQLTDASGKPLSIDGLWAISIGNDHGAGSSQKLYFTAGPNGESHGLFGVISAVPLPNAVWLFGSACLGFLGINKRKS